MPSLLEALQAFNRRERHVLVGWVLDRSTFPLGHEFRMALSKLLGLDVPADSYVAMDFNLNWLCAALMWSDAVVAEGQPHEYSAEDGIELGDNSDCDLIVAFARGSKTHVVLLEAKGYTPWATNQLNHKAGRLRAIFGASGDHFPTVSPSWVFVSPNPPPTLEWAAWMLNESGMPRHLPLSQPASHKYAVVRCDSTGKKKDGGYWRVSPAPWPGQS
jgi:hypothetical protein